MVAFVPSLVVRRLYNRGSLHNAEDGLAFSIKNRLSKARLLEVHGLRVDGCAVPLERVRLEGLGDRGELDLGAVVTVRVAAPPLEPGRHQLELDFETAPYGRLKLKVDDALADGVASGDHLPRLADDWTEEAAAARRSWLNDRLGARLDHVGRYSVDPGETRGNIEQFTGMAQVPIGVAGPLLVDGEHAQGEFYVPLACTEGTLVASYNRGMKALRLCGGARCSVVEDAMQRAPVFQFADARAARAFGEWVEAHLDEVRAVAEATSHVAHLVNIDRFLASRFAYLRFNYTTGDAAGQNMVGRATFAACNWILENYAGIDDFFLESNFATDKKASSINILRTRGKRVTAEAVLTREVLAQVLRVEPERLEHHARVANTGSFLSGVNNNGCHAANAITALFIATGQDVANVAESSAGIVYTELTGSGDLYLSVTLPSLIVATWGGGTGLPTQRECLEMMGCHGRGKVRKLAEIVAGTVLAGELSLAAAISSRDWVSSHERLGRNR